MHPHPRADKNNGLMTVERRRIQQLSPNLVNRIAAGEVIERPASVVKECVENALDAGASHVHVEIEDGGRQLIRIRDDGHGIPADELPLAFASHATSKLIDDADLFAIRTMGFRGEALASIGSVSFARVVSRTVQADSGFELVNRGGEVGEVRACPANVGTTIEVRDLFFNVPARRKFLRAAGTETGHVSDAITKIALARPDVTFALTSNGRPSLELRAGDATARWLAAWPESYASLKLDIDLWQDDVHLRGILGLPELAQPHVKYQYLYVNGRSVRDRQVMHALKEAYRGLCEPGRNPAAVLMLDLPADAVDVNVHPAKSEVRFRDGSRIHGLVLTSVRSALIGNDLVPKAQPRPVDATVDASRDSMRDRLATFFKTDLGGASPAATNIGAIGGSPTQTGGVHGGAFLPDLPKRVDPSAAPLPHAAPAASGGVDVLVAASATSAIQLHNSYLVAESDDGLVIIDQHALHERIMFEDLLARLQRGPLESQHLLLPMTATVPPQQVDALESLTPIFARLGIECTAIGPDAIAVHAFPSFLSKLDPLAFVKDVLERAEREPGGAMDHESLLHDTLDMMACKAAVKAGDALTPDEIRALLERRHLVDRASNCPHGRPTTLKLSLRDLEKQFKRTGF